MDKVLPCLPLSGGSVADQHSIWALGSKRTSLSSCLLLTSSVGQSYNKSELHFLLFCWQSCYKYSPSVWIEKNEWNNGWKEPHWPSTWEILNNMSISLEPSLVGSLSSCKLQLQPRGPLLSSCPRLYCSALILLFIFLYGTWHYFELVDLNLCLFPELFSWL